MFAFFAADRLAVEAEVLGQRDDVEAAQVALITRPIRRLLLGATPFRWRGRFQRLVGKEERGDLLPLERGQFAGDLPAVTQAAFVGRGREHDVAA